MKNNPLQLARRRGLRKQMTPWEIILWAQLKRKPLGCKFRRQHSIGRYIVDFYCAKKKFVIELDGGQHFIQKEYDTERTKYLNTLKIQVLRIWNDEIIKNIDGVMLKIEEYLKKDEEPSLSEYGHLPLKTEGEIKEEDSHCPLCPSTDISP